MTSWKAPSGKEVGADWARHLSSGDMELGPSAQTRLPPDMPVDLGESGSVCFLPLEILLGGSPEGQPQRGWRLAGHLAQQVMACLAAVSLAEVGVRWDSVAGGGEQLAAAREGGGVGSVWLQLPPCCVRLWALRGMNNDRLMTVVSKGETLRGPSSLVQSGALYCPPGGCGSPGFLALRTWVGASQS